MADCWISRASNGYLQMAQVIAHNRFSRFKAIDAKCKSDAFNDDIASIAQPGFQPEYGFSETVFAR
jgi:hypothetical protein